MNRDLENLFESLKANRLSLNAAKTEFQELGSRQRSGQLSHPNLKIADHSKISAAKMLRVHIDQTLSWAQDIEISKKYMPV